MPNIGFTELAVLLGVAVLIFGAKRIPETARALGRTFNAFKSGMKDDAADAKIPQREERSAPENEQA